MPNADVLAGLMSDPQFAGALADPELAPVIAEMRAGGAAAVMKHLGNPKVASLASALMSKLGGTPGMGAGAGSAPRARSQPETDDFGGVD